MSNFLKVLASLTGVFAILAGWAAGVVSFIYGIWALVQFFLIEVHPTHYLVKGLIGIICSPPIGFFVVLIFLGIAAIIAFISTRLE